MDTSTMQLEQADSTALRAEDINRPDPRYAGLNRKQRREAQAVERRAARKGLL